ncbi:tRNA lysidine(34) synthetase TilS [Halosquirtibacter laminarini]|uniref:tRNA lysidine(34) synthetase TilS n=1 Tax=Halosquirtibacter laminarini TaxID=3374600 RepID=A0AC61NLK3_9BACT|nr:tRNA lysidine(34) synthetase TilS [Prolixibacteraceae bacterium]
MLFSAFKHFLETREIESNSKVLLAVSGGVDSMVMADLFQRSKLPFSIAHCNFKLRAEESEKDTTLVHNYALSLDIPFYCEYFDTTAYAEENNLSIEMAARNLRYDWFYRIAEEDGFDYIAIAHHRDDSLETFILNWTRGAGIKGLTGIDEMNHKILRPLIEVSRDDIIEYADIYNIPFRHDASNDSEVYLRNIVRHSILPQIDRLNDKARAKMNQSISYLKQVENIYRDSIAQAKERVVYRNDDESICIDKEALLDFIEPEQLLYEIIYPLGFNSKQVGQVMHSVQYSISGKTFLSQCYKLVNDRDKLLIYSNQDLNQDIEFQFSIDCLSSTLPIPMEIEVKEWTRTCDIVRNPKIAYIDLDKISEPLVLRHWKRGDKFRPLGMRGFKKVSDYFIDRKWNIQQKESAWILCSGDEIIWIVGERLDDRFKVHKATIKALIIRL